MSAIDDLRRLVSAARSVVDARASIVPALVEHTGLTREGVELALARHLEIDTTDDDLERLSAWAARAGRVDRVAVVLSANVFVGALRAIAVARALAPAVVVRPSRREPVFARALVAAAADPSIVLDEGLDVAAIERGQIHVYGRDDTIARIRSRARVPVRGHGSGMGIALVDAPRDLVAAARSLAADVVPFDQRGCASPRVAIVLGDFVRATAFAEALHDALEELEQSVPRGAVPAEERAEAARYVETMTVASRVIVGSAHAIGIAPPDAPLVLPPPYRHVHVAPAMGFDEAVSLAAPLGKGIAAIGSDEPSLAAALASALRTRVRTSSLGAMQRPPLDGPMDLRAA